MALPPAAAAADAAAHLFDGLWKHLIDGGQSLEEAMRGKRKSHIVASIWLRHAQITINSSSICLSVYCIQQSWMADWVLSQKSQQKKKHFLHL